MPRHMPIEAFQMDHLRTSPSQQHLNPSRSSSIPSQREEIDQEPATNEARPHRLDLYSIPVFLLELLVLGGLAYSAYFIHFQYKHEPLISGFYCDDISLRQHFVESKIIQQFSRQDNELVIVVLFLAVPVVLIVFCELVNSMFGALKFRQIRALCACCKLHSITRRTIRFSGAYLLGFFIVMISCDILANNSGRFRPYFAQECPAVYKECLVQLQPNAQSRDSTLVPTAASLTPTTTNGVPSAGDAMDMSGVRPPSAPISSGGNESGVISSAALVSQPVINGVQRLGQGIIERKWIDLTGLNLVDECRFSGDSIAAHRFEQLPMSWPSFPAAIFSYACLFTACYLAYVGTARPFRIITCVLVMLLLLITTMFDVQLVKEHYHHWDDVVAGSFLAVIVVIFVLIVYLNKFKDTHYYEKQKLLNRGAFINQNFRGYNNEAAIGSYNLDKTDGAMASETLQNGDTGASLSNNDLAMRYFQIPRANYRGAPRPMSINHMRS